MLILYNIHTLVFDLLLARQTFHLWSIYSSGRQNETWNALAKLLHTMQIYASG